MIADSSTINITGNRWGQDYFNNLIEFASTYSKSVINGSVPSVTVPANTYSGFGYYNIGSTYKKYKHFINHTAGTPSGTTYTLSDITPSTNEVYRMSIVGIKDGSLHRTGEYILFSGQTSSLKSVITVSPMTDAVIDQNVLQPRITVNTSLSLLLTIYIEKVGADYISPSDTIIKV